jgi:hypothetical protein
MDMQESSHREDSGDRGSSPDPSQSRSRRQRRPQPTIDDLYSPSELVRIERLKERVPATEYRSLVAKEMRIDQRLAEIFIEQCKRW